MFRKESTGKGSGMAGASIQDECSGRNRQERDQEWQEPAFRMNVQEGFARIRIRSGRKPAFRMNVQEGIARIGIRNGRSRHSG
ncbi:hypothetical protein [Gynuella sunshinyii]|uniref:hypothetical protein n=1 Tax=Gynuella sunshinyii TaxID=1445505 RepID=UPI0005CC607C|nr:hypothetical protein [Gynuella sunshinyii]